MEPVEKWEIRSYQEEIGANIRAERARAGISQTVVAERMRALGFDYWLYQTASASERGTRRVTANEILGLALAMGTTVPALMRAGTADHLVSFPGYGKGQVADPFVPVSIGACSVTRLANGQAEPALHWIGDRIAHRFVASYDPQPGLPAGYTIPASPAEGTTP